MTDYETFKREVVGYSVDQAAEFQAGYAAADAEAAIAQMVYDARRRAGFTLDDLAERAGLTADELDDIESGTPPTTEELSRIAAACHITLTVRFDSA
ncbi:helix-turn-helix domain-containing protein [Gordonia sp. FQ]|uniref:helix-turn-helix domain-containing protein n=1 Tax=Gordonia sp. FQ TaxID=3446634 RepID=UPI003F83FD7B